MNNGGGPPGAAFRRPAHLVHVAARGCAAALLLLAGLAGCTALPAPTVVPVPSADAIVGRLVLLGDGGKPAQPTEPVLEAARRLLAPYGAAGTLVLLGDNIYPAGLPAAGERDSAEMHRRLLVQVQAGLAAGADVVLVPGNHDWDKSGPRGDARRAAQVAAVAALRAPARVLPADGCPGPVSLRSGAGLRVLALDTQWFLHPHAKREDCPVRTLADLGRALRDSLVADTVRTLVVAHHPLRTYGEHGGYFPWQDHLFPLRELNRKLWIPLPLLGTLYPVVRGAGVSRQDTPNRHNRALVDTVLAALAAAPPLLYASGHEHNLQVIDEPAAGLLVVSGAGYFGHESPVFAGPGLAFGSRHSGGMVVDRLRDGRVRLGVFLVNRAGEAREVYSRWLR